MDNNTKVSGKLFKIIEFIYAVLLITGYFLNIKDYMKKQQEGGLGDFYTFLLGIGILIICYRLFTAKKMFRWYEYIVIVSGIVTMLINQGVGVFVSVLSYMMLLYSLYFEYDPSIKRKNKLTKIDKYLHIFIVTLVLMFSISSAGIVIFNKLGVIRWD
ncbi:hypothetical protein [Sebaldella sp. S0638]|uniref:hypothetical protein n=1 Tax=Sebaldella sp. S0638 TaxID=2957809 RepID=UPI0020A00F68|nr:hypothetical protein [Sebaldella sp. S0638]